MNQTENSLAFHHDGQLVAASPLHYLAVPEQVFLVPLIPIEGIDRVHETHTFWLEIMELCGRGFHRS
jgi:hypothetical protein